MSRPAPLALAPEDALALMQRSRSLLTIGGMLLTGIGFGWCAFFVHHLNWPVAILELGLAFLGVMVYWLSKKQRYRAAGVILFSALFATLCAFSLFLDLPTAAAPRSSHIYFLSIGLCAFYVMQNEKDWLRYGVVFAYLAAFQFFASSHYGIETPYAMPDEIRIGGTWINTFGAILVFLTALFLMHTDQTARSAMHIAMRDALAARRFHLFYQPQVDKDGKVVGAEALLRWHDPERGWLTPSSFIAVAEQSGFVLPLGRWAISVACQQLAQWQQSAETRHLTISCNVSPQQVRQPDFVEYILSGLKQAGAPASQLKLELTESMLVLDVEDLIGKMKQLNEHGVGFSLDDFGTGNSSLSHLKRMPLHQIKIDRSFTHDVLTDQSAAAIASTLITLSRSLKLAVIAEGVENQEQFEFLKRQGCRAFQGHLFSPALEISAFNAFVQEHLQSA